MSNFLSTNAISIALLHFQIRNIILLGTFSNQEHFSYQQHFLSIQYQGKCSQNCFSKSLNKKQQSVEARASHSSRLKISIIFTLSKRQNSAKIAEFFSYNFYKYFVKSTFSLCIKLTSRFFFHFKQSDFLFNPSCIFTEKSNLFTE